MFLEFPMNRRTIFLTTIIIAGVIIIGIMMRLYRNDTLYLDPTQPVEKRIENLIRQLSLKEKVSLCHGNTKFTIAALERFNIPELVMRDGPCGVREESLPDSWESAGRTDDSATALPTQVVLACTWNTRLAKEQGEVLGSEARFRGKDIICGPGINMLRTPLCGRNFEYMGEDPYLTSQLAVQHIRGMQLQGTAACVKHFLANNQEFERNCINVVMDERALREIYLPGFKAAVEQGGALSVMGAYNKFRGQHCSHNKYLLLDILKCEMKFKGVVISDWDGCHNTDEAVNNGLDIEMGTEGGKKYNEYYLADPFIKGLREGKYDEEKLDEKVHRILYVIFKTSMSGDRPAGSFNTFEHQMLCRKVAEEGIVLLKNNKNILPLDSSRIRSIAVIGANASQKHAGGGGSSYIKAKYEITPLDGLKRKAGTHIKLNVTEGYSSSDTADTKKLIREAVAAAAKSDVAVIYAGLTHIARNNNGKWNGWDCEGFDNNTWELPWHQYELIQEVAKVNPRTIVFIISGPAYSLKPISDKIPVLLYTSYAGMEAGNAMAEILFGDVNPSGKLAFSYPAELHDSPAHAQGRKQYPGVNHTVHYSEGIYTGYRWYDSRGIQPLFCFGHGLSYTTFKYDSLALSKDIISQNDSLVVSIKVTNTGNRSGAEVIQLYIHDEVASVDRPFKELKGFEKIFLNAGEIKTVKFFIRKDALSFWGKKKKCFIAEPGNFKIMIGSSSRDIRLEKSFELK
jgi:beta-glucosidase